jgi:hypothetical protein
MLLLDSAVEGPNVPKSLVRRLVSLVDIAID